MRRLAATFATGLVAATAVTGALAGCTDDQTASPRSFCDSLRRVPALASVFTGFADQDAGRLDRSLDEAEAAFGQLRESAPEAIEPDVTEVVDLVQVVIDGVRANPTDPDAAAAEIRAAVDDHPDAVTSSLAVADYARTQCDVELNPTVPEDPTPADPTGDTDTTGDVDGDFQPEGGL
jgi:hypothetical protein